MPRESNLVTSVAKLVEKGLHFIVIQEGWFAWRWLAAVWLLGKMTYTLKQAGSEPEVAHKRSNREHSFSACVTG